jgi:hypothetical protein
MTIPNNAYLEGFALSNAAASDENDGIDYDED